MRGPDPTSDRIARRNIRLRWNDHPLEASNEDTIVGAAAGTYRANVVTAHNRLGMLVFQQLLLQADPARADDGQNESVFVSPISIALALGMAYNGAGDATAEAMAKALQLMPLLQTGLTNAELNAANLALLQALDTADSQSEQSSIHLDIANSLWYHRELTFIPCFCRKSSSIIVPGSKRSISGRRKASPSSTTGSTKQPKA